ncbi:hypothetical protein HZI73_00030 [Vallitalea pronyensis]|uniref:Uncharacterized protein n=1 Tax=Vallitalea pronyensis TaxID=1348613 RepID=A0A8J8MGC3_9FIRM|nr:hypothetical protein [Vallitalea pronyensis]QUI20793.1 hypothetical protein HZI73_00030 [Vallitalea pronyensis]
MSKLKMARRSLIVMTTAFIIGIILIFSSAPIGKNIGTATTYTGPNSSVSTIDPDMVNATTINYRVVGTLISLVGGVGILLSGYAIYKEL